MSWASHMCLMDMIRGGKQEPLVLNLSSEAQAPWTSPRTTTLDLF
jgi:hypothetical protein